MKPDWHNLGLAIGLQALYQQCAEMAVLNRRFLTRREFMTVRLAVFLDPVTFVRANRIRHMAVPSLAMREGRSSLIPAHGHYPNERPN